MDKHHFQIVELVGRFATWKVTVRSVGRFATWKVTVRSTDIIDRQLENVQETNMLAWEHNWIGHTSVWNSGFSLSETLSYKVYLSWQCEHRVFFAGDS
jgi:hypothetical protein